MDLGELRRLSRKDEPMRSHTLRIPPELDNEIRGVCGQADIKLSVIFRQCLERGWEQLKADSQEIRELAEELR